MQTPNEYVRQVPRVFEFVDMWGGELHTISDPMHELPIPANNQMISVGCSRMVVESVTVSKGNTDTPIVYRVRVQVLDSID